MSNKRIPISVCIITKNEEQKLPTCLKSIQWAPEVIVVDDYSSDGTRKICRNFKNVKYSTRKFDGFGMQKNYAISLASNDWILNIDADEEVTPELQTEISSIVGEINTYSGYCVRRKNLWFGKYYTDSYPGILRLFRKSRGRYNDSYVHEKVQVGGEVGQLEALLVHKPRSFENFKNHYTTYTIRYGKLAAKDYFQRGERITGLNVIWKVFLVPYLVFIREYILKKKLLQGKSGFYISLCSSLCYHKANVYLAKIQHHNSEDH